MNALSALALLKGLIWMPLLYVALRHRRWENILVVLGVVAANYFTASGHVVTGSAIAAGNGPLIVFLLIHRLYMRPEHVKHVATAQVAAAREEVHDARGDAMAWQARARTYMRVLDENGIDY